MLKIKKCVRSIEIKYPSVIIIDGKILRGITSMERNENSFIFNYRSPRYSECWSVYDDVELTVKLF